MSPMPLDDQKLPWFGTDKVVRREGDLLLIERKDCHYVVANDREDGTWNDRDCRYFYYPTKRRTATEAREQADAEFVRRLNA